SHADSHNNLGVARKEQGRIEDALASYRRALELKPTHAEALNNLGLAQSESVLEDRKSTRLNSSHDQISYAVFCLKKKSRAATLTDVPSRPIQLARSRSASAAPAPAEPPPTPAATASGLLSSKRLIPTYAGLLADS